MTITWHILILQWNCAASLALFDNVCYDLLSHIKHGACRFTACVSYLENDKLSSTWLSSSRNYEGFQVVLNLITSCNQSHYRNRNAHQRNNHYERDNWINTCQHVNSPPYLHSTCHCSNRHPQPWLQVQSQFPIERRFIPMAWWSEYQDGKCRLPFWRERFAWWSTVRRYRCLLQDLQHHISVSVHQ